MENAERPADYLGGPPRLAAPQPVKSLSDRAFSIDRPACSLSPYRLLWEAHTPGSEAARASLAARQAREDREVREARESGAAEVAQDLVAAVAELKRQGLADGETLGRLVSVAVHRGLDAPRATIIIEAACRRGNS